MIIKTDFTSSSFIKQDLFRSAPNSLHIVYQLIPILCETDDLLDRKEIRHGQLQLEHNNSINCLNDKTTSIDCNNNHSPNSVLSATISKILIDMFVKDPIKFYGEQGTVHVVIGIGDAITKIKPKEKFILFNVNGHKIMIPMDKKIAPIDIPVKLRNSMKTLDKQLNTITTPSQFTTTQQEAF
ncbi:unnamed protein product [Rotaria sp. Silwood1]|nr:unnamed protein product [Rotaria sp. Silwood1]CAF4862399.1 unnamed protein product [Rotaria sp. Silwood1]